MANDPFFERKYLKNERGRFNIIYNIICYMWRYAKENIDSEKFGNESEK